MTLEKPPAPNGAVRSGPESLTAKPKPSGRILLRWIALSLAVLAVLAALVVLVTYRTVRHLYARAPNPVFVYDVDRSVRASIADWVPVQVELDEKIPVRLSKELKVKIPVRERLDVWIQDEFSVPVDTTLTVPIDQEVYIDADVPVELQIPLDGFWVRTNILGLTDLSLPVSGTLPVKTTIRIRQPLHVKTVARIPVRQEITVPVRKKLVLPLNLDLDVKLPIEGIFDVRVPKSFSVRGRLPEEIPVAVRLRMAVSKDGSVSAE